MLTIRQLISEEKLKFSRKMHQIEWMQLYKFLYIRQQKKTMNFFRLLLPFSLLVFLISCDQEPQFHHDQLNSDDEFIFLQSNQLTDNQVLVFQKKADGSVEFKSNVSAHGTGTGANVGSDGTICLSQDKKWLYAVNAGSNTLAVFRNNRGVLTFTDTISTAGIKPVSVTTRNGKTFVVNAGGNGSLVGFKIDSFGILSRIGQPEIELNSTPAVPAQISFDASGNFLVISEKLTNRLVSYYVDVLGNLSLSSSIDSQTPTPYGFAVGSNNYIYISEASANALSIYKIENGLLSAVSGPHYTTQNGACWVALLPNLNFAYVLNAGSSTITGFNVSNPTQVTLLNANGVTATAAHPNETAVSQDGKFVYFLQSESHSIGCFAVNPDGSLTRISDVYGLPIGCAGMEM